MTVLFTYVRSDKGNVRHPLLRDVRRAIVECEQRSFGTFVHLRRVSVL